MKRIYFDLDGLEHFARIEWERMISIGEGGSTHFNSTSELSVADLVVAAEPARLAGACPISAKKFSDRPVFCWDSSDRPDGYLSGLYCGLGSPVFRKRAHINFSYPITYNEQVGASDLGGADMLWGFFGGITSPLRRRIANTLKDRKDGYVRIANGPWFQMFNRTGIDAKVDYAESLARTKYFICPRGNGFGSIRLFETMKARRVPIILADRYALPDYIDWSKCALVVKERDISKIPAFCRAAEAQWEEMAQQARLEWEKHFGDSVLIDSIGAKLSKLVPSARSLAAASSASMASAEKTAKRMAISAMRLGRRK